MNHAKFTGKADWFYPKEQEIKFAIVITHGFNLKPSKMDTIGKLLMEMGGVVIRLALTGHTGDYQKMRCATRADWLADIAYVSESAKTYATQNNIPCYYLGMSLGGLMQVDWVCSYQKQIFDRAIFLAPAIKIHWYCHLLRGLNIFGTNFNLPSKAPKAYRLYDTLPISAYNALYHSIANVAKADCAHWNIPTLVFIDPRDELVDIKKLTGFIHELSLDKWRLIELDCEKKSRFRQKYHHLIIDPNSMGPDIWRLFVNEITQHLR